MASAARQVIEDMVPELQALEDKGYFSRDEIRNVIRKREDFELRIRRKAAVKTDFLRYIDFERSFERLRQLRKKARNISSSDNRAEHSIVRRTHFVFERMLRKFRGDISLWSRWLDYCRQTGSGRQMSKVLTRALQLHPTHAPLWAYAAAWEFENNNNAAAARALMQTGLRMCRTSPQLWHEYFKLEVLYANRLWARRQVLGLKHVRTKGDEDDLSAKAGEQVMKGGVARIVYKNAVTTMPQDVGFRVKFIHVLQPVDLPGKAELMDMIFTDIATAFPDSAETWQLQVAKARTDAADPLESFTSGLKTYVQGLQTAPSTALVQAFQTYLSSELDGFFLAQGKDTKMTLAAASAALSALQEVSTASASLLHTSSCIRLRMGDVGGAFKDAEAACAAEPEAAAPSLRLVTALSVAAAVVVGHRGPKSVATELGIECSPEALLEAHPELGGSFPEVWLCLLRAAVAYKLPLEPLAHAFRTHYLEKSVGTAQTHHWGLVAERFVHAAYASGGGSAAAKSMFKLMEGMQLDRDAVAQLF